MDDPGFILAPENFALVEKGIYRSAFPRSKNHTFLKRLQLRSVVSLVPEDYPTGLAAFYESNGIKLLAFGVDGNKWPFKEIDHDLMSTILLTILDERNRPLLIHCNKGKHRTGSVVGCLRKLRQWSLSSIFAEYIFFASPKFRWEDQIFIETYNTDQLLLSLDNNHPRDSVDESKSPHHRL
jgi:tyrosine-protein phosphatase SIW14